jgi:splicing factor U2AF subunit
MGLIQRDSTVSHTTTGGYKLSYDSSLQHTLTLKTIRKDMAQHLARIHGTEEDKVNCPFYFKIGACRHSDRCSRLHHRPAFSPTLLVKHLYRHPVRLQELQQAAGGGNPAGGSLGPQGFDEQQAQLDFLEFYEDLYTEFGKFG